MAQFWRCWRNCTSRAGSESSKSKPTNRGCKASKRPTTATRLTALRNPSATAYDRLLPRRSRRTARIDADRGLGAWRIGATVVAQGARYDDVQNAIRMGGYATADLRAERRLGAGWMLQAALRNAFDRGYETAAFYNQPGREWSLTLRYAPR